MDIDNLQRRLNRLRTQRDDLLANQLGNEQNYTYWGGYNLGYAKGKIDELENLIDNLNDERENS
jgi:hypothetical protein